MILIDSLGAFYEMSPNLACFLMNRLGQWVFWEEHTNVRCPLVTSHQEFPTHTGHQPEVDLDHLAEVGSSRVSPLQVVVPPLFLPCS